VISLWKGVLTVKKSLLWLAVLLFLANLAVPTVVMADGNPMPVCPTGKCSGGPGIVNTGVK